MKQKTLLETLYDNKPGSPPEPVMWLATLINRHDISSVTVGPHQTWYAAREEARITFTQRLNKYIDVNDIYIQQAQ